MNSRVQRFVLSCRSKKLCHSKNFQKMNIGFILVLIVNILITLGQCELFSISTAGIIGFASSSIYYGYNYLTCKNTECCTDDYIHYDFADLNYILSSKLHGQHIVLETVINALRGHVSNPNPPKALAMSFHGSPGTGKNYVAKLIAEAFYKKGFNSQYVHFFQGRNDFPLEREVDKYRHDLKQKIQTSLEACEKSLFIFDEVDKMPPKVLDVLVPFLDHTSYYKSWQDTKAVCTSKAVYIFLSNTGSQDITRQLLTLWESGKKRHETTLHDFENLVTRGAFNEKGGFYLSDTIESSSIDHYIPFLPLEEEHVKLCVKHAFAIHKIDKPTKMMIEEAMAHLTFGPPPYDLYSTSGCKRIEQKVAAIAYMFRHKKGEKS